MYDRRSALAGVKGPDSIFSGGGQMGELMRQLDWGKTPLGPVRTWSPALRMMTRFLLANRFPLLLWWGPRFCQLYNDAYRPILGNKHPQFLGYPVSECWSEIWHILEPLIRTPFEGGPSTWMEDIPLEINRHGFLEETHFTIAYSPVPDDTVPGSIGGVLATVHEISEQVVGERRTMALRDLGAGVLEERTAEEACARAADVLARYPKDVAFALFYLLDRDRKVAHLAATAGVDKNQEDIAPPSVELADEHTNWPFSRVFAANRLELVKDIRQKLMSLPAGVWSDPPECAAVLPIRSNVAHQLAGFLVAGISPRLRFDHLYQSFLELAVSQIATAIANARAYEEERSRAEMLEELDRAKTVFFSNVSHEFRTPLTLMVGPLEAMLDRAQPASTTVTRDELQLVHRNCMRLLKLVNTLLDFSRIEAGRVKAFYEPTDLATLTADTASAFRSAMEQAGLQFTIDCQPVPELAYVDRDMWEKIVLNLISNAFKFTLVGGVTVGLRAIASGIELRVEDTGSGIPDIDQSKVFERFHRLEGIRGRTHEGTGIGLALVQELVKLHRGTIRLKSTVGKGSTFVVTIPRGSLHLSGEQLVSKPKILKSTGVSAASFVDEALRWLPGQPEHPSEVIPRFAADSVQAPHLQTTSGRILLADDNADMRGYVRRLLGDNYEVHAVSNGREALAAIRNHLPDLVLTDVMMPELDGFGLLRELRADEKTNTIPIILLSARAGEEARIEGMEAGADDYMVKPFTSRELLARVGSHLALGRLRREAAEHERTLRAEAENIATALEVTRKELESRVQERTAELQLANDGLRELSSRLQQLQDEERRQIARGLHDSAGQLLSAVAMNMAVVKGERDKLSPNAAGCVADNIALIDKLISEVRTISHLLHPPLLDEVGLVSALHWYVDGFSKRSNIAATLDIPENLERLPDDTEIAIFRAVQECLTNVHRHSGGRSCSVSLVQDSNSLRVEISDDGKGISLEKKLSLSSSGGGVGLRGMQERIRKLGGTLGITSSSCGTTVTVVLPSQGSAAVRGEGTDTLQLSTQRANSL